MRTLMVLLLINLQLCNGVAGLKSESAKSAEEVLVERKRKQRFYQPQTCDSLTAAAFLPAAEEWLGRAKKVRIQRPAPTPTDRLGGRSQTGRLAWVGCRPTTRASTWEAAWRFGRALGEGDSRMTSR